MNKNALFAIIMALPIAMLGSTIADTYAAQNAEDADSAIAFLWCYSTPNSPNDFLCYTNHGECSMVQSAGSNHHASKGHRMKSWRLTRHY